LRGGREYSINMVLPRGRGKSASVKTEIERAPLNEEERLVLETYFRAEYAGLLRVAMLRLHDPDLAETAVQDTFLLAGRKYEDFIACPKPAGWLYTTLKYVTNNLRREDLRITSRVISMETADQMELSTTDAYPCLDLTQSDDPDLRLLTRFYAERIPAKELAKELGINLGACKMRIKRARQRMEQLLKNEE